MKVQIEEISPIKKKLSVEVPRENYEKALEQAYQKLGKTVQIKGFRKGKVPRSVLEKYYGAKASMETISELVDQSYREAVQENKIMAVGLPKIEDLKMEEGAPVTFTAEVEVQPQVKAKNFEKIKLKKKKAQVSDEEFEAELKALQKAHAQWVPLPEDAAAQEGHSVTINFEGFVDGKAFQGGSGQNVSVQLGAARFLPDFEKGLLGAKMGENREFEVGFPEEYGVETLRNKTATFKAEILGIKKEELPNLDDEFAKDLGKYETFEQIRAELKDKMLKSKESQERGNLFKQVMDHLIAKNSFDIPGGMIERELDFMWKSVLNQLSQQKVTPESMGIKEEEYKPKNREEAIRRIKGFLLFDSIASQNEIKVEDKEIEEKLGQLAEGYRQPVEVIKKFYQEQGLMNQLYSQILEEKTLDFIISKAKVSEK